MEDNDQGGTFQRAQGDQRAKDRKLSRETNWGKIKRMQPRTYSYCRAGSLHNTIPQGPHHHWRCLPVSPILPFPDGHVYHFIPSLLTLYIAYEGGREGCLSFQFRRQWTMKQILHPDGKGPKALDFQLNAVTKGCWVVSFGPGISVLSVWEEGLGE